MTETDRSRHIANFEELKAARLDTIAGWKIEDAARDAVRTGVMDSFDRGLAAFNGVTGLDMTFDAPEEDAEAPSGETQEDQPATDQHTS